ncbi:hypothetical protein M0811_08475 [Anaeramoeba ignava]|uniref:Uncharacterized protein n=1 Tax=Anaeramoeba ignava TaxID=1746090 RepID=A0A9Q0LIW9_ANAIG|nr:hypothetical protein M0811_08475 [Anaeramoeba ignava]
MVNEIIGNQNISTLVIRLIYQGFSSKLFIPSFTFVNKIVFLLEKINRYFFLNFIFTNKKIYFSFFSFSMNSYFTQLFFSENEILSKIHQNKIQNKETEAIQLENNFSKLENKFNFFSEGYKSLRQQILDYMEEFEKLNQNLHGIDGSIILKRLIKKLNFFIDSFITAIPKLFPLDEKNSIYANCQPKNSFVIKQSQLGDNLESLSNFSAQNHESKTDTINQKILELIQNLSNFLKEGRKNSTFFHIEQNDSFKKLQERQNPLKEKILNFRDRASHLILQFQEFTDDKPDEEVTLEINQLRQLATMRISTFRSESVLDNLQQKMEKFKTFPQVDTLIEKLDSLSTSLQKILQSIEFSSKNVFNTVSKGNSSISFEFALFTQCFDFLNSSITNFDSHSSIKNDFLIQLLLGFLKFLDLILDLLLEISSISFNTSFHQNQAQSKTNQIHSKDIEEKNSKKEKTSENDPNQTVDFFLNQISQLSLNFNETKQSEQKNCFVKIGVLNAGRLESNKINQILSHLVKNYEIDILMIQNLDSNSVVQIRNFDTFGNSELSHQQINIKEIDLNPQSRKKDLSFFISSSLMNHFKLIDLSEYIQRGYFPRQIKNDQFRYHFGVIEIGDLIVINFLSTCYSQTKLLINFCAVLEKLFPQKQIVIGGSFHSSIKNISSLFSTKSPKSHFRPIPNLIKKSHFIDSFPFFQYFLTNYSNHLSFSRSPFVFGDEADFSNLHVSSLKILNSSLLLNVFQFGIHSN